MDKWISHRLHSTRTTEKFKRILIPGTWYRTRTRTVPVNLNRAEIPNKNDHDFTTGVFFIDLEDPVLRSQKHVLR